MWWRAVGLVVLACSLQVCLDYLGTVSGRAPDRSRDWDPMSAPSDRERNCPKWLSLLRCAVVLPFVCAPLRAPWCCLNSTCKWGRTRWPRFAYIRGTTPMRRAPLPSCPMRRVHAGAHVLAGGILRGDVRRCSRSGGAQPAWGSRLCMGHVCLVRPWCADASGSANGSRSSSADAWTQCAPRPLLSAPLVCPCVASAFGRTRKAGAPQVVAFAQIVP